MPPSWLSIVIDLVAASRNRYSAIGLSSLALTRLTSADMNACCLLMRSRSLPLPRVYLARTYPSACRPPSMWCPADRCSPDFGSLIGLVLHSGTPPTALTMSLSPSKLTTTKWSMWMWVLLSAVLMTHAVPSAVLFPYRLPIVNASLILKLCAEASWLLPIRQAGMFTHESRGMDITSAHFRFAATCTISRVSERSEERRVGKECSSRWS